MSLGIYMKANESPWYYWNNLPANIPADIEKLSTPERKGLLEVWEQAITTENAQNESQKLSNIRELREISLKVPPWLMDRTKEAASLYVEGCWLASISLCGSIGEYVTWHMLQSAIMEKGIRVLVGFRRSLDRQIERVNLLFKKGLLSDRQAKHLRFIAETRNEFVHLAKLGPTTEVKPKALDVLRKLIELLNEIYPADQPFGRVTNS